MVAVGTPVTGAPRTEPYERLSRIRLPPRVIDGKAITWPGVADFGFGEPVVGQLDHALPGEIMPLAAARSVRSQDRMIPWRKPDSARPLVGPAWELKKPSTPSFTHPHE